ncbi:YciI family protein [Inquilinus sp. NPDC058860]|uniref:YciI family protein n=1 Tax=Inquilinus sp. NPDC058860 TaxID=3346652 RepID=UPI0036A629FC
MLYAILCYNSEEAVGAWTQAEDDAVMARLDVVHKRLAAEGKLGPAARLAFTADATTLMKGQQQPLVIDGPYAETKEQMLGFYLVDCESRDEAVAIARDLAQANPGAGGYEIRPIRLFLPGIRGG